MNQKINEQDKDSTPSADADTSTTSPAAKTTAPEKNAAEQAREERIEMLKQVEELKKIRLKKQIDALEAEVNEPEPTAEPQGAAASGSMMDQANPIAAPIAHPVAKTASLRGRHVFAIMSFLIFVLLPTLVVAWYMYERAADRYVSYTGFSVRTEETGSAFELLGGVAELSGSSSSDTDILYRYIQSQELVAAVDARVDLEAIWDHPNIETDPFFAYEQGGTIEEITAYWKDMVSVFADTGTGLIDLQVQAFNPEDAQLISNVVFDESLQMINRLTSIAQEDATRYAREELDQTVERLKETRTALNQFRNRTQIIDPAASITSQLGILASLQSELAQTMIDLDMLRQTTNDNDPRVIQTRQRIDVIEVRIAEEQGKFGQGTNDGQGGVAFADLISEFEILAVDLEFAEASYQAARVTLDASINEARRQSRYLAAHIRPTLPQKAEQPHRFTITLLYGLFSALAWAVILLAAYAVRDRR